MRRFASTITPPQLRVGGRRHELLTAIRPLYRELRAEGIGHQEALDTIREIFRAHDEPRPMFLRPSA